MGTSIRVTRLHVVGTLTFNYFQHITFTKNINQRRVKSYHRDKASTTETQTFKLKSEHIITVFIYYNYN